MSQPDDQLRGYRRDYKTINRTTRQKYKKGKIKFEKNKDFSLRKNTFVSILKALKLNFDEEFL